MQRPQKRVKKGSSFKWHTLSHFSDWLGKGFEIRGSGENRIFEVKSVVGFYRDSLLNILICAPVKPNQAY